jgi:prepilin-type N-terminal cleavage/methylation domain-containing protein
MPATDRDGEAGTTLIESLVVLAILGMTAAIGFPKLQQALAIMSLRQSLAAVTAELHQVLADALRSDRPELFVVSRDGRAYGGSGSGLVRTPAGVEVRSNSGRMIEFYGDGSSTGGEIGISVGRRSRLVRVSAVTGAISEVGS